MNCPFLECERTDCGQILNMQRLEEVFRRCVGHFFACPVYQRGQRERTEGFRIADFGLRISETA